MPGTTHPASYQPRTPLPSASLNASLDGKADLDSSGHLDLSQVPASLTDADAANAAAITAINGNVNAAGGFAKVLSGGKLPLGILPYSAGTNISIDGAGVISSTGGGGSGITLTPPTEATFPISLNEGVAPYSYTRQTARGLKVAFQAIRGGNGMRMRLHPIPAAGTPWQVTMCFALPPFAWASQGVGISRYDSVSGKNAQYCITAETVPYGTGYFQSNIYENVWANDYATYLSGGWLASVPGTSVIWMRCTDTGTMDGFAWLVEISRTGDPDDWFPIRGGTRDAYLGAVPTHFGISAACPSGNVLSSPDPTMTILHYSYTHG